MFRAVGGLKRGFLLTHAQRAERIGAQLPPRAPPSPPPKLPRVRVLPSPEVEPDSCGSSSESDEGDWANWSAAPPPPQPIRFKILCIDGGPHGGIHRREVTKPAKVAVPVSHLARELYGWLREVRTNTAPEEPWMELRLITRWDEDDAEMYNAPDTIDLALAQWKVIHSSRDKAKSRATIAECGVRHGSVVWAVDWSQDTRCGLLRDPDNSIGDPRVWSRAEREEHERRSGKPWKWW